jgi:hypothetical protein
MGNDRKQSDDDMRLQTKSTTVSTSSSNDAEAALSPEAQGLIGHQLRQEYKRLLSEPLPDKFTKLLSDLAKSEPKE